MENKRKKVKRKIQIFKIRFSFKKIIDSEIEESLL